MKTASSKRVGNIAAMFVLAPLAFVYFSAACSNNGTNTDDAGGSGGGAEGGSGGDATNEGGSAGANAAGGTSGFAGAMASAGSGGMGVSNAGAGGSAVKVDAGAGDAAAGPLPSGTPVLVVTGDRSRRLCSTDGTSWGPEANADAPANQENGLTGLAIGKGFILAAGESGAYVSSDCRAWRKVVSPAIPTGFPFQHPGAAFGNGRFVIISHADVWWSEDLMTWNIVRNTGDATHWRMTFGAGRFVAVGDANAEGGRRKWSTDGVVWKDYQQGGDSFLSIAFGNDHFVAVGAKNLRARSRDGVVWESRTTAPDLGDFGAIAFGDGKFLACTYVTCVSSTDGATWSAKLRQPGGNYTVGFGLGTWIIGTDKLYSSKSWTTWTAVESTKGPAFARVAFGYIGQ